MQEPQKSPSVASIVRFGDRLKPGHQVRCVDCGYLSHLDLTRLWGKLQQPEAGEDEPSEEPEGREIFVTDREKIRFRRYKNVAGLSCFRHVPLYEAESEEPLRRDEVDKRIYDAAVAPRNCELYQAYVPGLPPRDHLLMQHNPQAVARRPYREPEYWLMVVSLCGASFFFGLISRPIWEGLIGAVFGLR